jgi:site-specific DNA-cytosine methylase
LDKADKQRLIQMGNAIPPQVAYQIFKSIQQYINLNTPTP